MPGPIHPADDATFPLNAVTSDAVGALCVLVVGGGTSRTVALAEGAATTFGRGEGCDVQLGDPSVSRRHAVLEQQPTLAVRDLGSANGTYVGRRRLRPHARAEITLGEIVRVGATMLVVQEFDAISSDTDQPHPSRVANAMEPANAAPDDGVVVRAHEMEQIHALVAQIGPSSISVLLLGETGVGKEVVAAAIHRRSSRSAGPFVQLHCAALSPALLESELFGHEKGAFTGAVGAKAGLLESAQGGTVFLDEVGELPLPVQVKLLRVLEERRVLRVGSVRAREIDVRFVAATNRDLRAEVAAGAFRRDLYFRLNGISLTIPPLRERVAEIAPLARLFLARATAPRPAPQLAPEVLACFEGYAWPGNVRELRNAIERAALLCGVGPVTLAHLPAEILEAHALAPSAGSTDPVGDGGVVASPGAAALRGEIEALERRRIVDALDRCGGNQTRAAELLGMPRRTLVTKLGVYGIARARRTPR